MAVPFDAVIRDRNGHVMPGALVRLYPIVDYTTSGVRPPDSHLSDVWADSDETIPRPQPLTADENGGVFADGAYIDIGEYAYGWYDRYGIWRMRPYEAGSATSGTPGGPAGGVLDGTFPSPKFADSAAGDGLLVAPDGLSLSVDLGDLATQDELDDLLSRDQADALAGTSGAPGLDNPYATLTDPRFRGTNDGEN